MSSCSDPNPLCPAPGTKKMAGDCGGQPLVRPSHYQSGHRLQPVLPLRRKRTAAATTPIGIRVLKHKALAHERLFILKGRAIEIENALRIHKDPRAEFLENLVA